MSPEPNSIAVPAPGESSASDSTLMRTKLRTPGAGSEPAPDLISVPGYEITGLIARGGMGVVFAARDLTLDREVAIKILRPGADPDRFVTEAKITAGLAHPAIPPVHAIGALPDGGHFLVMKLVSGDTLAQLLKDRPDPGADLPRLLHIFEQMAQAVGFAHSRGVLHRDLKPLNIMVGAFGEVQVMDWGLAKDADTADAGDGEPTLPDAPEQTRAGVVMGTPGYMAPEQARGEAVDARADVFALGSVLAAILTGRPAFVGSTVRETIDKAAAADLTDVCARLSTCGADAELVALARRCLSADKAERPTDARAVAAEVGAYRAGVEARLRRAEADRARAETRAAEQRKRHRVVQWAAGGIAAVLLLGVVGTGAGLFEARQQAKRAGDEAEKKEAARAEEEKQRGIADDRRKAAEESQRRAGRAEVRTADVLDAMVSEVTGESLEAQQTIGAEQKKFLALVLPYYREFAATRGTDESARFRVARAASRLGYIEYRLGRLTEAVAALESARDECAKLAAEFPGVPEYRLKLAASHNDLGHPLRDLGRHADAERHYREALALKTKLAAESPAVVKYRQGLAASHNNLGVLLWDRARHGDAERHFAEALAVQKQLVAEFPEAPEYRQHLAKSHNNLGALLRDLNRHADAEGHYRKSRTLYGQLADAFPAVPEYRAGLAHSHTGLGNLLTDLNRRADAEEEYRKGLALRAKLVDEFPGAEYRADLARSHTHLGFLLKSLDRPAEAEEQYRKALAIQDKLTREFPDVPAYRQDLAGSHNNLGALFLSQKQPAGAIEQARLAIEAAPTLSNAHVLLGVALKQTGDVPGARAALTEAARLDARWQGHLDNLNKQFPPPPIAPLPREKR